MRRPRRSRSGRGRSVGVAGHRPVTGLSRSHRAIAVACLVALASLPSVARAQGTQDRIEAARAAVDDAANRWFAAQAQRLHLATEIVELQQRIDDARARVKRARRVATARAVEIYKGASADITGVIDGSDALDSARRAELVERANEQNRRAIDALEIATDDLDAQRRVLEARHEQQQRVLHDLAARRSALDAQLLALRARAGREAAAAAARAAVRTRAARTAAATRPPSSGPVAPGPVATSPPPDARVSPRHDDPFLVCTREHESGGVYTAVSPAGYYGAYQFSTATWDVTASHARRLRLVGVLPSQASEYDQDEMAWALYQWQGKAPWGDRC